MSVEKHRPIFKLHPWERYNPVGFNWWVENVLKSNGKEIEYDDSLDKMYRFPTNSNGDPLPKKFAKLKPTQGLYSIVKYFGATIITYQIFFAYNGSKRIAGIGPTGAHSADIEVVHVYLMPSGEVGFYGLSTHGDINLYNVHPEIKKTFGSRNPVFKTTKTLEVRGGRPVVFSSLDSHALYGRVGSYFRFYGFGNDNTADGPEAQFYWEDIENEHSGDRTRNSMWIKTYGAKRYFSKRDNRHRYHGSVIAPCWRIPWLYEDRYDRTLRTRVKVEPNREMFLNKPLGNENPIVEHHYSMEKTRLLMYSPYALYLLIPYIVYLILRKKRRKSKLNKSNRRKSKKSIIIIPIVLLLIEIYGLKLFFYFFGHKYNLVQNPESVWGYVFPLRLHGSVDD